MIVYLAQNKINGKQYVGYTTKTLEERKQQHIYSSNSISSGHYFYLFKQAIRKYNADNFEWTILARCKTKQECCNLEKQYIVELNTISPKGYNLTEGGNGGIPSEDTKAKISTSVKKYWEDKKEQHPMMAATKEIRSDWAVKAWQTKRQKGYTRPEFTHTESSKDRMSVTKNEKNKHKWTNIKTGEFVELSLTKMAEYTKLSVGVFYLLKRGSQKQTKCGWTYEGK